jgi:hypothetical protein
MEMPLAQKGLPKARHKSIDSVIDEVSLLVLRFLPIVCALVQRQFLFDLLARLCPFLFPRWKS